MAVKLLNGGNPKAGAYDVNDDGVALYDDATGKDGDEAPAGVRLEGRGMPTGPMFFKKRRFTGTSEADEPHLLKHTATAGTPGMKDVPERRGRLSWEELKPR